LNESFHQIFVGDSEALYLKIVNKIWGKFLAFDVQKFEMELFRKHERTGRPLEEDSFIEKMELLLDRKLKPLKPGPKKKDK